MKKRLWLIFGPVILACVLVLGVLLVPLPQGHLNQKTLREASVSMAPNILLGQRIKDQALKADYVPFMGSSELSRMDAFHPSVLAAKYDRNYRPFLLGAPGTQSLTHYLDDQSWIHQYRGKKIVFIVSLQWFTPKGVNPGAFQYFYSPLQAIQFLQHAKPNDAADRYAAQRLLKLSPAKAQSDIREGLLDIAAGVKLGKGLNARLAVHETLLRNEDSLFSRFTVGNHYARIEKGMAQLPDHATDQQLSVLAGKIGAKATTNNHFGIENHFFAQRLGGDKLAKMRGKQAKFDYRHSPEYGDFQLLLDQFAKNHIQVQFVIPPINHKWARYTHLSQPMVTTTTQKLKHQLKAQGFSHVLDLTKAGSQPYFMQDTIHLGWRGWVAVDKVVDPFLTKPQKPDTYRIQPYFFSKGWANAQ